MLTGASPSRPHERRRFHRVEVTLLGRYMLSDEQEYPCQTRDMSPGSMAVTAPVCGALGERVVAYLEQVGRVEGEIARILPDGFAMTIRAAPRKRDKLASQLTWLANRHALGLPEDRRHERITPRIQSIVLHYESGRQVAARILDVSLSGAALSSESKPAIGAPITVGSTAAKVVRHFNGGSGVEFRLPLSPDRFDETIVL